MAKEAKEFKVAKLKAELEMKEMVNAIPLCGWHSPLGTFTRDGHEWGIAIGGGCQTIVVTTPKDTNGRTRKFVVSVSDVIAAMLPKIDEVTGGKQS